MFKGGFPPIFPIDNNKKNNSNEPIKRNFSNIIDINTILKKRSSVLIDVVNESSNSNKKKRNFKNKLDNKNEDNLLNFINDLTNIKKINRINKTKKA
jgi:hypothetical protein